MRASPRLTPPVAAAAALLALPALLSAQDSYTFTNVADSTGSLNDFVVPSINSTGTVAFLSHSDGGGVGIYTGSGGGEPVPIVTGASGPLT